MRFDLDLFTELNREYRDKPVVPRSRVNGYTPDKLEERARRRAGSLAQIIPVEGAQVLEIGCGRGELARSMVRDFGAAKVVGVDITEYAEWSKPCENVHLVRADLSSPDAPDLGTFDSAYSIAVWEHVRHPFTMLKRVHALLKPGGKFHLVANLYRGPQASHRYRDVFFPWPHLLFADHIFEDYYQSIGKKPLKAEWVNQLTIGDYHRYFYLVGFKCEALKYDITPIDEPFYKRFSDVLERIPRFDLERDFIHATLVKK